MRLGQAPFNEPIRAEASREGIGAFPIPVQIVRPSRQIVPAVLASPHSGRHYPPDFVRATQLDLLTLRSSEDAYVDTLVADAVTLGAPLVSATFPRAYLDVNREAYELDPTMFADPLPGHVNTRSIRVAGGLGTIARVVADGREIYPSKLALAEAEDRIERLYRPYHRALSDLVGETRQRFGRVLLLDCHSMPSVGCRGDGDAGQRRPDIILGDRYGASCRPDVMDRIEDALRQQGFSLGRNAPYAGGYTTQHYGNPFGGIHAVQIEINRALYMDERTISPLPDARTVKRRLTAALAAIFSQTDDL